MKVTIFVTELEKLSDVSEVLLRFYGETLPASTLLEVKNLIALNLVVPR